MGEENTPELTAEEKLAAIKKAADLARYQALLEKYEATRGHTVYQDSKAPKRKNRRRRLQGSEETEETTPELTAEEKLAAIKKAADLARYQALLEKYEATRGHTVYQDSK